MKRLWIVAICSLICPVIVNAGRATHDGGGREFWREHSLVYGNVQGLTNVGIGECRITFLPIATLTGDFDCGLSARIVLEFFIVFTSKDPNPPKAGSRAIMLIWKKIEENNDIRYIVPSSIVTFMPNGAAFVVVNSIEDEEVSVIMKEVRDVRRKSSERR